ncbi:hypothetical protein K501DRAFT_240949 [Backusella circina FSU 941]|nr:hypothetical protein K501DRAFT_240949 [Backusella circina FSU 941]
MTTTHHIPTWRQENQNLLDAICQAPASSSAAESLLLLLQTHKDRFLNLFDTEPKNATHRANVQSKKVYINQEEFVVSTDFAEKCLFLSDQLGINEHAAAALLMAANSKTPKGGNAIDTAVVLYYTERGYLLACLQAILKYAKCITGNVKTTCTLFLQELIQSKVHNNKSFIRHLLDTLSSTSKKVTTLMSHGSTSTPTTATPPGLAIINTEGSKLEISVSGLQMERLSDERLFLVQILYHLATLFCFETDDKIEILKMLEDADLTDPATAYMIIVMIATLNSNNNSSNSNIPEFISQVHERIMTHGSKVPVVKAVIVLQWVLYLSNPEISRSINLTGNKDVINKDVKQLLDQSIHLNVFGFMNEFLLYFQQKNASIDTERGIIKSSVNSAGSNLDRTDYRLFNSFIRSDFQPFVLYELEQMATTFITHRFSVLQQLKYVEEDSNTPSQSPLSSSASVLLDTAMTETTTHRLADFYTLLASIYRDQRNNGIKYWTREHAALNHFLRWTLDIKVAATVCAAFDFLGSITTGDQCAIEMLKFFDAGTVNSNISSSSLFSWGKPFAGLQFYVDQYNDKTGDLPLVLPQMEESILIKFLFILQQTIQYSAEARRAFWDERAVVNSRTILLDFSNCPTSTTLRASVFDVFAAFCSPWGGGVEGLGREISHQMWKLLEQNDTIVTKYTPNNTNKQYIIDQTPRFVRDIELEKRNHIFTETLSIISLLGSAIHTQSRRDALVSGFQATLGSVPPGFLTSPYIGFVVDTIFLGLSDRKYTYAGGQWQLAEACLFVMENSVMAFDVQPLEEILRECHKLQASTSLDEKVLLIYMTQPGFDVLVRILSGGRLINELFRIILTKWDEPTIDQQRCRVRCLRILSRVFEIEDAFYSVLLPKITELSKNTTTSEVQIGDVCFPPLPSVVSLSQLFLFHTDVITELGVLVNKTDEEEVCLLSTRLLQRLSTDMADKYDFGAFSHATPSASTVTGLAKNIATVMNTSVYAENIISGAGELLSIDTPETMTYNDYDYDINNIPFWRAQETLDNIYEYEEEFNLRLNTSPRLAILDLLLENAGSDKPFPTMTEFLLGYDLKRTRMTNLMNTDTNRARMSCLHTLSNLLRQGIQQDDDDAMMEDINKSMLLIDTHPILAEKCYKLIYQLCSKRALSTQTIRYLRYQEDFFYQQLNSMSIRLEYQLESDDSLFGGKMVCADGSVVPTDFFRLRSKLHQRAFLLESIALELRSTANSQQKSLVNRMLELLYGHDLKNFDRGDVMETDAPVNIFLRPQGSFEQPLVRMLEFVDSLNFRWYDDLAVSPKLKYFTGLKPENYTVKNQYDCEMYDIKTIYKILNQERLKKVYVSDDERILVEEEVAQIISHLVALNHTNEIRAGKRHCMTAWKQVIHVTLIECFDYIAHETRERILFELLAMLITKISSVHEDEVLSDISYVILSLLNRLKKDMKSRPASQLPTGQLKAIFSGILDCIQRKDSDIYSRGDMYTAINVFLLFIDSHIKDDAHKEIEQYLMDQVTSRGGELLDAICSDAINVLNVWKTTAFIALDALNTMALKLNNNSVQQFLIEKNFLQYTIETIRNDDSVLSTLLEQIDAPLQPLYIFEAKMSILLKLATNANGAQLLVDNRIFEVLGHCHFIRAQQQDLTTIQLYSDSSSELMNRYNQLLIPTLKLISAILICLGSMNDTVLSRAEEWARRQQTALVNVLKEKTTTITSLEKLKLVTTIVFLISCRKGYLKDLDKRGINQLHNAMTQLVLPSNSKGQTIPTALAGGQNSSLEKRTTNTISSIKRNIEAYSSQRMI